MRGTADRIRHAISFEITALVLITPLGAWTFGFPVLDIGVLSVVGSLIATIWTYAFNLGFDRLMQMRLGHVRKSLAIRAAHTVLFEVGLTVILVPLAAWYLGIGLWQALLVDIYFVVFYMVYAFAFNWGYDVIFPVPEAS